MESTGHFNPPLFVVSDPENGPSGLRYRRCLVRVSTCMGEGEEGEGVTRPGGQHASDGGDTCSNNASFESDPGSLFGAETDAFQRFQSDFTSPKPVNAMNLGHLETWPLVRWGGGGWHKALVGLWRRLSASRL